jgi:hypothetical protein
MLIYIHKKRIDVFALTPFIELVKTDLIALITNPGQQIHPFSYVVGYERAQSPE